MHLLTPIPASVRALCLLLLGSLTNTGCSTSDLAAPVAVPTTTVGFTDPEALGPYPVGVRQEQMMGGSHGPYVAEVYYPAEGTFPAGRTVYDEIAGLSMRDAKPLRNGRRFGVAIFSHGLAGIREQNTFQVEYLASHGWIVASIDHVGSRLWDFVSDPNTRDAASFKSIVASANARPGEVSNSIDTLLAWNEAPFSPYYGLMETSQVAAVGHSFGAFTVIAAGGAEAHVDQFLRRCVTPSDPMFDNWMCDIAKAYESDTTRETLRFWDPRIKAIVPLAPGATTAFGPEGIGAVQAPVLLMAAQRDAVALPELFADFIPDALQVPYVYLRFKGANHLDFSQICQYIPRDGLMCGEGMPMSARAMLARINVYTVAFLGYYVKGEAEYGKYLGAEYASDVTWVEYTAKLK